MEEKITINGIDIWFTTDEIRILNPESGLIESQGRFHCYYKFSPSTILIPGEFLKDESGRPYEFSSPREAIEFAKEKMSQES